MARVLLLAGVTASLLAAASFASAAPPRPPAPPKPPEKIIDMHMHAMETDGRWEARVGNPVTGQGVIDWTKPRKEFHRYLRGLVQAGYGKRVMFGSDQMVWPEAIEMAVAAVQSADYLTPEQRGDIFYHNAARFLRLEPMKRVASEGAMETLPRE